MDMWNAVSKTATFGTPGKLSSHASMPPKFAGLCNGPSTKYLRIEAVAREAQVGFLGLWVDAPLEVRKERVMKRLRNPSDVKTAEELEKQLSIDVGPVTWDKIDTSGDRMVTLSKVRSLLSKF